MDSKNKSSTTGMMEMVYVVITNLIPCIGVLFFNWSLLNVVLYYWVETVVMIIFALLATFTVHSTQELTGDQSQRYLSEDILLYFTYSFFYLCLFVPLIAMLGVLIIAVFGQYGNDIPDAKILHWFYVSLNNFCMIVPIYAIKFFQDRFSHNLTHKSGNIYEENLFIRMAVLFITLCLVGLLVMYLKLPILTAVLVFTVIKIWFGIKALHWKFSD